MTDLEILTIIGIVLAGISWLAVFICWAYWQHRIDCAKGLSGPKWAAHKRRVSS